MALEAISSNDLFNFLIYDSLYAKHAPSFQEDHHIINCPPNGLTFPSQDSTTAAPTPSFFRDKRTCPTPTAQGRKKRRRRPKVCKNKEEAETQRMTHIVVERNRRKQMNDHLSVLRSLMPESYSQRGDQASMVGGAIEYVKELEHLLQSLEAQKLILLQKGGGPEPAAPTTTTTTTATGPKPPPFAEFFSFPQYTWSQSPNKYNSKTTPSVADIEVTLIESHANLRVLARRRPRHLSKLLAGFQLLQLSILHLSVTSLDSLVLYSISAKVEEGCQLTSVDDIAEATHHMLRIVEEEAAFC